MQFDTLIEVEANLLPAEYVRFLNAQAPDDPPLERDEEVPDIPVVVDYNPGYFQSGNRSGHPDNWTPDEGEDPEIVSVEVSDPEYDGPRIDLTNSLPDALYRKLSDEAWEHQTSDRDFGF